MRSHTIHKPTHRFFDGAGAVVAVGQVRGDVMQVNRLDASGAVVEKAAAVGTAYYHISGYGKGVTRDAPETFRQNMASAWRFLFADVPVPVTCEPIPADAESLPVIFRAERSGDHKGDVTAVFPSVPGSSAHDFQIYAHIGQHGTGGFSWYQGTRPATPEEAAPLLAELRRIYERQPPGGCDPVMLHPVQRFHRDHDRARREEARRWR